VFPEGLRVLLLETSSGLFIHRILAHIASGERGTGHPGFVFFKFVRHISLPDLYFDNYRLPRLRQSEEANRDFLC